MLGAHSEPVTRFEPALGTIMIGVSRGPTILAMAWAMPECTGPTRKSTFSFLISLLVLVGAFGTDISLSMARYSMARPPSLPPACSMRSLSALVMASPSFA